MNENLVKLHELTSQLNEKDEQLRQQKDTYESLVELLPEVVLVLRDDKIVFINTYGLKVFNLVSKEQVIGESIGKFVHEDDLRRANLLLKNVNGICNQEDFMEVKLVKRGGDIIIGEAGASTVTWKGEPAVQAVIRDITHIKRLETEILQHQFDSGEIDSVRIPKNKCYEISDGWSTTKLDVNANRDIYTINAVRGSDLKKHFHKQKEIIEIIKGEMIVFLDEKTHFLKSGDSLEIPPFKNHKMTALSDTMMRVTFAPPLSEL